MTNDLCELDFDDFFFLKNITISQIKHANNNVKKMAKKTYRVISVAEAELL